jgi:hypothetical protein
LATIKTEYIIQGKKVKYPRLGGSNERTSGRGAGGLAANVRRKICGVWFVVMVVCCEEDVCHVLWV